MLKEVEGNRAAIQFPLELMLRGLVLAISKI